MEPIDLQRRNVLLQLGLTSTALVTGCSRIPIAEQIYEASTVKLPDADEYPVTAEKIAASPYASLGAQFQGQPKVVMTLATAESGQLNWVSSNHLVLSTRQGLIVSTKGLPIDLVSVDEEQASPIATLLPGEQAADRVYRRQSTVDVGGERRWIDITSSYRNLGLCQINVLGQRRNVWLIEERTDYKNWRWRTVNQFWVDPLTRFSWRSRQQFTPEVNPVLLEVLKPYA